MLRAWLCVRKRSRRYLCCVCSLVAVFSLFLALCSGRRLSAAEALFSGEGNRIAGSAVQGDAVYETGLLMEKDGQTAYIRQLDGRGKTIRLRRLSETSSIRSVSPPFVEGDTLYLCADTEEGTGCLLTFTAADLRLKGRISLDQTGGRISSVDGDRAALLFPAAPYIALVDLESAQSRPIIPEPAVSPAREGGAGTDTGGRIEKAVLAEERLYLCGTMTAGNGIEGSTTGYIICLAADGSLQWQDKYTDYHLTTGDIPVSRFTDLYVEGGRVYAVGMHGEIGNSLYRPEEKGRLTCAPLVRVYDKDTGVILHTGSYRRQWKNTEFLRLERAEDGSLQVLGGPAEGTAGASFSPAGETAHIEEEALSLDVLLLSGVTSYQGRVENKLLFCLSISGASTQKSMVTPYPSPFFFHLDQLLFNPALLYGCVYCLVLPAVLCLATLGLRTGLRSLTRRTYRRLRIWHL